MFSKLIQKPRIIIVDEDVIFRGQWKPASSDPTNAGRLKMQIEESLLCMFGTIRDRHDFTKRPISLFAECLSEGVSIGAIENLCWVRLVVTKVVIGHRLQHYTSLRSQTNVTGAL
jgi:hypothetical protein